MKCNQNPGGGKWWWWCLCVLYVGENSVTDFVTVSENNAVHIPEAWNYEYFTFNPQKNNCNKIQISICPDLRLSYEKGMYIRSAYSKIRT